MGLRCSLFGHDYGEPFVERDREERGNEVVVTERELTECARCGAEKVTSQNTEVRSLEADRDAGRTAPDLSAVEQTDAAPDAPTDASPGSTAEPSADATADASPDPSPDTTAGGGTGADARTNASPTVETDDATGGAFTSASDAIDQAEAGTSAPSGGAAESESEPADSGDDAVIMDDATDDGPGSEQWGEHSEPDPEQTPAPEPEPDDEEQEDVEFIGSSTDDATPTTDETPGDATADPTGARDSEPAEPTTDQSTIDQHAAGQQAESGTTEPQTGSPAGEAGARSQPAAQTAGQAERARGEWPEHDGDDEGFDARAGNEGEDAAFQFGEDQGQEVVEPAADPVEETQFTSVGPVDQSGSESLDYALYCPECGFERGAAGSSLRAGDICPECRRGYLAEDR